MRAILAIGAIVVSTAASAQLGQGVVVGPDNGFFRPTPGNDPSIHAPVLPSGATVGPSAQPMAQVQPQVPVPAQVQQVPAAAIVPVQVTTPPASAPTATVANPVARTQAAESELDRAQREAEAAQQRARQQPAPINGAFTGLTDEKDR
jgi:hypothetical protein